MSRFSIENFTKRNQFTRMCIGEAVIELMSEKEFDKIRILDITKKAGVSRVTFYKYYKSKEEIISDYLNEMVTGYLEENKGKISQNYPNYENTVRALEYFDRYSKFFQGIKKAGLYSLLINAVNEYMEDNVIPNYKIDPYEVYYYAGAILNVFYKWQERGKKETKEYIAGVIAEIKI